MKRGTFDILRRGLDNTVANWQLILLRLAETFLFVVMILVAAVAIVVPILVSIGIHFAAIKTPDDLAGVAELLAQRWMLAAWIVVAVSILMLVFVAMHSFVEAGCARVYVDGERLAGPEMAGPRSRYAVFSISRFFAGGKDGWWTVFWIYNLAWGVAGLVILIPLVPTALLMLLFSDEPRALVATGCLGLVVTLLVLFVVAIATGIWTNRAIAHWALHRESATPSLAAGWSAVRLDPARHLLVVLAVVLVMMAGSSIFAGFSFAAAFGEIFSDNNIAFQAVTLPLRIFGSLANSIFSTAVTTWYLACFTALAVERRS